MRLPSLLSSSSGALDLLGITDGSDGAFAPLNGFGGFATRGTLQGRNNNLGQRVLPEFWTAPIGAVRTRNFCLDALYLESRIFNNGFLRNRRVAKTQLLRLDAGKFTNEQAHAENFLWGIRLGKFKDTFHDG